MGLSHGAHGHPHTPRGVGGLTRAQAALITDHSARHFYPHVAEARSEPPERAVEVGKWSGSVAQEDYIAQLEALAALGPMYKHPQRFAGRRVIHFIDNTVALSALVHGYVGKEDLADIVNAYSVMGTGLRARTYFDYVPSKANLADLPSRGEQAVQGSTINQNMPTRACKVMANDHISVTGHFDQK